MSSFTQSLQTDAGASLEDLVARERAVLKRIESKPTETFLEIRKSALKELKTGEDFRYPIFSPVLKRIIHELES